MAKSPHRLPCSVSIDGEIKTHNKTHQHTQINRQTAQTDGLFFCHLATLKRLCKIFALCPHLDKVRRHTDKPTDQRTQAHRDERQTAKPVHRWTNARFFAVFRLLSAGTNGRQRWTGERDTKQGHPPLPPGNETPLTLPKIRDKIPKKDSPNQANLGILWNWSRKSRGRDESVPRYVWKRG